ncbi:aminoglycoside phosphotransferase [Ornithinimicrobium cavernae]|uniref:aminoglycoside phosphotransferase n=1 Tax=Ornithinimicrobium cavernae TaxID=2666047 RepID=UPI000D69361B|nr:aminoglycoside phosphotransferase [Ornithinimicrobium cavernae]
MQPSPAVFDLFAVPAHGVPVGGGQGHSVHAGDLVLSPGRDSATAGWLNPLLARLAAELDHERPRSVRIAMPIPARDLRWVVQGWGASRFEPGTRPCRDLDVLLATGRLLHARLAAALPGRPPALGQRQDRWARAERLAFETDPSAGRAVPDAGGQAPGTPLPAGTPPAVRALVTELAAECDGTDLGPDQLVHGDLAGNVLLDATGLPLVIDVAPYWRPVLWAEAVCVLDAVRWWGADRRAVHAWATGAPRQAMVRAAIFRVLSDPGCDVAAYRRLLQPS